MNRSLNRISLSLIWIFAFAGAVVCFSPAKSDPDIASISQSTDRGTINTESWKATMGWRYVAYAEGDVSFQLQIEPMVKGNDVVYVPNEASWLRKGPSRTNERRAEVLSRLKSVAWNRKLSWREGDYSLILGPLTVIPGSLESTPGGKALEDQRFFEPGSKVTHEKAHEMWEEGARLMAEQASGTVRIFAREVVPGSVFQAVELPALLKNPNVTLVFK